MASNVSSLQDVEKIVKDSIVEVGKINIEQVTDQANIIDDLGFDSLDSVELIMHLEEEFGINIDDSETDNLKTVNQIVKAIASKLKIQS